VDEKVHATEPSTRKLHDTLYLAEQIKIGADEMGRMLVTIATGIPFGGFKAPHILSHKDNARALLTEGTRNLTPNALTGAGDERGLSL
jgi:hypothetical protein